MATVYGPASAAQIAAATSRPHRRRLWLWAIGAFVVAIVALNGIAQASQPAAGCRHKCPTPPPPTSPSVSYSAIYHSSSLGFRLAYDPNYAGSPTATGSASIAWEFALKGGGYLDARIYGTPAGAQTPQQALSAAQSSHFSGFQAVYPIPAAEIGYVLGAGEVYQGQWSPMMGSSTTERLALVAATKNGVTLTAACEAPKIADNGAHANPAEIGTGADQFCDQVINTVTWK
ncbi:MAG TPA: hypothetical protein VG815_15330 [Chloroflexota bacterium]|nr:hypothetical protein [Chloroflexota bacterium]